MVSKTLDNTRTRLKTLTIFLFLSTNLLSLATVTTVCPDTADTDDDYNLDTERDKLTQTGVFNRPDFVKTNSSSIQLEFIYFLI